MTNDAYRTAHKKVLAALLVAASAVLMSSCGGGGAAGNPTVGGDLVILPDPGTAYAGIPFRVTIAGGRPPYALGSSEPSIFPVPAILNGNIFDVLPGQPGVVDTGLTAGEVPRRAVVLTARDVGGQLNTADYSVLQNFLIGYGVSYTNDCPAPAGGATAAVTAACSGRESAIRMAPTFNGQLRGNALMRFERLRGGFTFTQCASQPPVNPAQVNAITQNTDHTGVATVCIFVPLGTPSSIAAYRIIDVATGVYAEQIFLIDGDSNPGALTALPATVTFTGTNGRCGTGSADFLVFDGNPPYTATSTNGQVAVTGTSNTQPGRFTVTVANNAPPCPTGAQIIVTDSLGLRATVTIESAAGAAAPAIQTAPSAFNLACGQSGSGVVVGGSGPYSVFSSDSRVTAAIGGNQVLITRLGVVGAVPVNPAPLDTTVNITDGTQIATITVTSPTNCPP